MTTYRTLSTGSSPRMRGTRSKRIRIGGPPGIIPAYAGNTRRRSARRRSTRDHPRVCGEHCTSRGVMRGSSGSSPRMRGTLASACVRFLVNGIIPAYAGNTHHSALCLPLVEDHPRVCGEHLTKRSPNCKLKGSSPRMRGTRVAKIRILRSEGIIPAYAGNTCTTRSPPQKRWDHPRVCGEHYGDSDFVDELEGSSPRMRGTLKGGTSYDCCTGIIPAYAGNTIPRKTAAVETWDHPRVCGEHHLVNSCAEHSEGSSPRMRGTRAICIIFIGSTGIIPAYAGNTIVTFARWTTARDHPRVCGEHEFSNLHGRKQRGSSPRMRGTRVL